MIRIDEKDKKIINVLKTDSRSSIRAIARKTGLRPSTVHQRIEKMKEAGVIEKFTVKMSSKAIDESFVVFMLLSTKKDLDSSFLKNVHIKEVFGITGDYDLLMKLRFKDLEQFNDFIINLRKNPNIVKTHTLVVTTGIKEEL